MPDKTDFLLLPQDERESITRLMEEGKEEVARLKKETDSKARILARVEAAYKEVMGVVKVSQEEEEESEGKESGKQ